MLRHPLENPSLAPHGLVLSGFRRSRLDDDLGPGKLNTERLMARLWDRYNRPRPDRSMPIEAIVHEIMPRLAPRQPAAHDNFLFCGKSYRTRDIVVLSGMVQWFSTNCGTELLERDLVQHHRLLEVAPEEEFLVKLAIAGKERTCRQNLDMTTFLTHVCTDKCTLTPRRRDCHYEPEKTTSHDRILAESLMVWLGTSEGRGFIADYQKRRKCIWEFFRRRFRAKHGLPRKIAA